MSRIRILCVDDEPNVLSGLERLLGFDYDVQTATSGEKGLELIRSSEIFTVVISDMRMPKMDGATFLSKVRELSPQTIRILLTGYSDIQSAIKAVNEGQIFRFLSKPCQGQFLLQTIAAAIEQFRLQNVEKELTEETLRGVIGVLSEVLSLVNPMAFSRAERLRDFVKELCIFYRVKDTWEFEIAALLSQIGCVSVPEDVLKKVSDGDSLSDEESRIYNTHPSLAHQLLKKIPRLEIIAAIIRSQQKGLTPDEDISSDPERFSQGARFLKVAIEADRLIMTHGGISQALNVLTKEGRKDEDLIRVLKLAQIRASNIIPCRLSIDKLKTSMILNEEIKSPKGLLIIANGQPITQTVIRRLDAMNYHEVDVLVPTKK